MDLSSDDIAALNFSGSSFIFMMAERLWRHLILRPHEASTRFDFGLNTSVHWVIRNYWVVSKQSEPPCLTGLPTPLEISDFRIWLKTSGFPVKTRCQKLRFFDSTEKWPSWCTAITEFNKATIPNRTGDRWHAFIPYVIYETCRNCAWIPWYRIKRP